MILKQYYLGCLAHASYLIGDEGSRSAVIVDPQRDIAQYLDDAASRGLTIRHVFLTHFHADFVAGHLELRDRTGAEIHLGARAQAEFAFTPMHDGDELTLGQVRLRILETPGHTPESISIVITIGLGGKFATWAGSLLDRTRPILVIAEPGREQEAAMRLGRIGLDNVAGYLRDGMAALATWETIYPLLERACLRCHGPNKQRADFRVDRPADFLDPNRALLVPGDCKASRLIAIVEGKTEIAGHKLPDSDVLRLKIWIDAGAETPETSDR